MVESASPSVTISVAPRRTASGTKRRASCRSPGSATKQPPGSTRRESSVTDETDEGGAPTTVLTASAARSSLTGISRAISFRRPWRESEPSGEAGPERLPRPGRLPDDAALPLDLHREMERREHHQGTPECSTRDVRHDWAPVGVRSEEHTSELQSHHDLVCRLLLEKKKKKKKATPAMPTTNHNIRHDRTRRYLRSQEDDA